MSASALDHYAVVKDTIHTILSERGDAVPPIAEATPITECGLDSLDIAALVTRLEERFGWDPFQREDLTQYPTTVLELAELYVGPQSS